MSGSTPGFTPAPLPPAGFTPAPTPAETAPAPTAPTPAADDTPWRHLHPLTPWFRGGVTLVVILGALLSYAWDDIGTVIQLFRGGYVLWILLAILAVAVVATAYSLVWWRFARFRVGAEAVELRTGFIFRQHRSFRLDQLEAVDVVHPLIARLFGLAKLTLEAAGGVDSKLQLAYLRKGDAEAIRAELLHRRAARLSPTTPRAPGVTATPTGLAPGATPPESAQPAQPGHHVIEEAAATVSDAVQDMVTPAATTAPDETPLFQIPPAWTVGAFCRALGPWLSLALALIVIAGVIVFTIWKGPESLSGLVVALPLLIMPITLLKNRLLDEMWFTAFTHPDGLRLRHGLTTTINQTIPASRIQAISLTQTWLWRPKNWWRVQINVAGYGLSTNEVRTTLVPVADPGLAALAIGAVMPEAVRPDTWLLVLGAMNADLRPAGVAGPTRKARWLDPWTWQRNSVTWSGFALVIRTGRFRREIDLVPHARIQDLNARQGPLERRFGLASVLVSSMPGPVLPQVAHLDAADAAAFLAAETPRIWFPAVSPPA